MSIHEPSGYLRKIALLRDSVPSFRQYPFNLKAVRELDELGFHPKVTYLIGENGSGKSTLMEAIAVALGFNPEGGTINFAFQTAETHSDLHRYLKPVRGARRPRDGFFFRAESYYNLATYIDELDQEPSPSPRLIDSYGSKSLHQQSHGESFFATFLHRFSGNGLYILDEPEAALSPARQLSLLARMHDLIQDHSQFIIATHSPILMAYPDSVIYELTEDGIRTTTWEETEHYVITKQFLNNRDRMLRDLLVDEDED
ncbi:ATP-binding cassette domain-containing protein [Paenibacillus nanensis]|uniref:ATP-binding cassette domain-containing protein n=1 Tax=Paenibacillus nanensis TaxID=393251 RepID=A0A3A1UMN3_9BACL|nr:AAA family ATPase [Paenibacillus nanensis]RIX49379.1 ATP-binding cassette domain-containing protein [Paenibacillus nanensis]